MAGRATISGVGVSAVAAGAYLMYAGIRNVQPLAGMRELAGGKLPAGTAPKITDVNFTEGVGTLSAAPGQVGGALGDAAATIAGLKLGAVKPHVAAAAAEIAPKFGIKTVYGWAPGLYDHPKGLALDFMINNIADGRATGDRLVAYVLANGARLRITYVIWYRQIWTAAQGWHAYSGDSPHTDHVHVSFAP